ncbi:hypothetical protein OHA72_19705 [Dactylosporangium sp. NBC_01737]|nr:hypothetical protein OHA72_19705 [Dactylosporangium sp. NBC_01737]
MWRGGPIPREQDDFFAPSHIEHILDTAPELVPYLALPPGRVSCSPRATRTCGSTSPSSSSERYEQQ